MKISRHPEAGPTRDPVHPETGQLQSYLGALWLSLMLLLLGDTRT